MSELIVSLSPHVHSGDSISRNMYGVIFALIPVLAVALFYFGIGSAIVCFVSVLSCVFFEWSINKFILKNPNLTITDGSAMVTGLLLGLNLPSNLPIWIIVVGSFFAIGVCKMTFGGLGCNIFNPALAGRCFMLVSFPAQMTSWPVSGQLTSYVDTVTAATPLSIMKEAIQIGDSAILEKLPDSLHLLLGNSGLNCGAGAIGEVCTFAILLGFMYLIWKRIITWHIPVSIILTVLFFSGLIHFIDSSYPNPIMVISSGGLMFGAVFMATDYVTSPMTGRGQIIYGMAVGFLTVVIRNWGAYPEGVSFAILIMNAFTPLINTYIKPKRFGENHKIISK